jgi:uncharacterized protein YndB with AHSA1/START domain
MWIAGIVGVLVVGAIAIVAMQPSHEHIERSRIVAATPADVWPHVADYKNFGAWSPWAAMDPAQTTEISEPSTGVGAKYSWKSEVTGSGSQTFTVVEPESKIVEDLVFTEPFEATAVVTFTLEPAEGGTKVTWAYDTDNGFMAKAAGMFMDMDAMLGADFEKGLGSLAGVAEGDAAARIAREAAEAEAAAATATADPNAPADPAGTPANP